MLWERFFVYNLRIKVSAVALFFSFAVTYVTAAPLISYLGGDLNQLVERRRDRIIVELERLGLRSGVDFEMRAKTFDGDKALLMTLAQEIVADKPILIYAGTWDIASEFKKHTKSIPIVFAARANLESPVYRIVDNLQRPEGNITGFTRYVNLIPKKLQILKEAFPSARQVGFIYGVDIRPEREREYADAAKKIGIELKFRRIEKADFASLAQNLDRWDDAYVVAADDLLLYNRLPYLEQLAKTKRPVIHPEEATDKGVLMHYVPVMDGEAKAAEYISKILRGAKVRDLAVQEPQEFDLSVNVTTLKRNGLTMSRDVLSRARKVE